MRFDPIALAAIFCVIVMIILGSAFFRSLFDNPKVVIDEAPLKKNKDFMLNSGEQYSYSYILENDSVNMTYVILQGDGCMIIKLMEAKNSSGVCVDRAGMDQSGSNATYEDPSILLFKPWMLALDDDWRWNNSMYISYNGARNHIQNTYYRVVRKENYSGHESYVVEIKSDEGPAEYDWIDAEKRIVLRVIGQGYEVVLSD